MKAELSMGMNDEGEFKRSFSIGRKFPRSDVPDMNVWVNSTFNVIHISQN